MKRKIIGAAQVAFSMAMIFILYSLLKYFLIPKINSNALDYADFILLMEVIVLPSVIVIVLIHEFSDLAQKLFPDIGILKNDGHHVDMWLFFKSAFASTCLYSAALLTVYLKHLISQSH